MVIGPIYTSQAWFDRHFVPVYFLSQHLYELGEKIARIVVASLGLVLLLLVRPILGRAVARSTPLGVAGALLRAALALGLAVGAGELVLRKVMPRASQEAPPETEPLRQHDPRLGWVFIPSRVGHTTFAGRTVAYAFDANGYRVPSLGQPVDFSKPTIIFGGESIVTGWGLPWEETIPALVGAAFKTQSANASVYAYSDDQTYLRLAAEIPRFAHPTAVVILFSPGLFFRDFDDDRPRMAPGMIWRPAVKHWRLAALIRFFVPYHSRQQLDQTIAQTSAELKASVDAAHARGAKALIFVPQFGVEDPTERVLRERILDDAGLPYIMIPLKFAWRIPHNEHPNTYGDQVIAAAIVKALQAQPEPAKP